MSRRKVTPFARFLLAMIIIVPLAFAGASYINGEDPVQNFKQLVGMEQAAEQPPNKEKSTPQKETAATPSAQELQKENKRLRKELQQRDQAIKDLQKELESCQ
jgi:flagellar motility protein MotE (MotC chaperone)